MGSPDSQPTSASTAELPPLPNFSQQGNQPQTGKQDLLASLMSGIAPIKKNVDAINQAVKEIVKLGTIPGAEQIGAQIIALANQLTPMAAQNLLNPMGGSVQPGQGQDLQMMPPPGGPAPM